MLAATGCCLGPVATAGVLPPQSGRRNLRFVWSPRTICEGVEDVFELFGAEGSRVTAARVQSGAMMTMKGRPGSWYAPAVVPLVSAAVRSSCRSLRRGLPPGRRGRRRRFPGRLRRSRSRCALSGADGIGTDFHDLCVSGRQRSQQLALLFSGGRGCVENLSEGHAQIVASSGEERVDSRPAWCVSK